MTGKIFGYDERTGTGVILFDLIEFPFSMSDCEGPVILRRGDEVSFNLKGRDGQSTAFEVVLNRGMS